MSNGFNRIVKRKEKLAFQKVFCVLQSFQRHNISIDNNIDTTYSKQYIPLPKASSDGSLRPVLMYFLKKYRGGLAPAAKEPPSNTNRFEKRPVTCGSAERRSERAEQQGDSKTHLHLSCCDRRRLASFAKGSVLYTGTSAKNSRNGRTVAFEIKPGAADWFRWLVRAASVFNRLPGAARSRISLGRGEGRNVGLPLGNEDFGDPVARAGYACVKIGRKPGVLVVPYLLCHLKVDGRSILEEVVGGVIENEKMMLNYAFTSTLLLLIF